VARKFPHRLGAGATDAEKTAAQTARYNQRLNDIAPDIVQAALDGLNLLAAAADGVSIVEFNGLQNQPSRSKTLGVAIDAKGRTRSKCLFMGFAPTDEVMAHEVGHHLMCPHAHGEANGDGDGPGHSPKHHDKDDYHCLMSYNRPLQTFCGLCQLRLRGWDLDQLDKDGAKNEKT